MPSSNILLFDANKANMMADEQYNTNTQRLNGVQSGIASSQLQNKTLYQVSLVAYAIAQIMNQNGLDANDTAAVSAFVANLSNTMLQKVADLASTQEAQAGVATGKWMSPALVKAAIDTLAAKAQNILSDNTKTLFGLGSTAVPDDAFKKISQLLNNNSLLASSKAKIEIGSYIGTGTSGAGGKTNIVSSFIPKYWGFLGFKYSSGYGQGMIPNFMLAPYGETLVNLGNIPSSERESNATLNVSYSGKTISWYFNGAGAADLYQNNRNGYTYYYVFLGWGE